MRTERWAQMRELHLGVGRAPEQGFPTPLPSVYLPFEALLLRQHQSIVSTMSGGW